MKPGGSSVLHDKTEAVKSMTRVLCALHDVKAFSKPEEKAAFGTSDKLLKQNLDVKKTRQFLTTRPVYDPLTKKIEIFCFHSYNVFGRAFLTTATTTATGLGCIVRVFY